MYPVCVLMTKKRTIQPGGSRGTLFESAARSRLEDAAVLLEHERFSGAIYLAGYALECLLKWAVTRRRNLVYLPAELETHDYERLLHETGLLPQLARRPIIQAFFNELAQSWAPELRYLTRPVRKQEAEKLYDSMVVVYRWIHQNAI